MLKEAKDPVLVGPAVIAMTVIAGQDSRGRGTDFLRGLELTRSNAPFELLELDPNTIHTLDASRLFERHSVVGVNDKHPDTRFVGGDFLNQRLRWRRLLAGGNAGWTLDPRSGGHLNVVEEFSASPAIAADD